MPQNRCCITGARGGLEVPFPSWQGSSCAKSCSPTSLTYQTPSAPSQHRSHICSAARTCSLAYLVRAAAEVCSCVDEEAVDRVGDCNPEEAPPVRRPARALCQGRARRPPCVAESSGAAPAPPSDPSRSLSGEGREAASLLLISPWGGARGAASGLQANGLPVARVACRRNQGEGWGAALQRHRTVTTREQPTSG